MKVLNKTDFKRKIDLEKELKVITAQIIKKYQPQKIILFGSVADCNINESSDIDLLIIKENIPQRKIDRRYELSKLIDNKYAVDFFIYRSDEIEERLKDEDPFIENIIRNGKIIYVENSSGMVETG